MLSKQFFWNIQKKGKLSSTHNLGQNMWRLFHFLAQFLFTTTETEVHYYHQKVYELPHELASNLRLRKFQENPWNAWIWLWVLSRPTKSQILTYLVKNRKKSAVKHSIQKPILLNFVNLSPTFCSRLHVGIRNISSDACYDHTKHYQVQSEHRRTQNPFKDLRWSVFA